MYAARRSSRPHTLNPDRSGFTLIELMVAIAIIGILIAFLIPTIGGAINSVRVAEVQTEIASLEKAITDFKTVFGVEPPSKITLYETGADWDAASKAVFRQMFPQYDFADHDINGDGDANDGPFNLDGAECLLFFLGGNGVTNPTSQLAQGFSKNPTNPFASGGNRIGPFHEFVAARYRTPAADPDNDGVPGYLDSLPGQTTPFVYLSSNNGRGYAFPQSGSLDDLDLYGDNNARNPTSAYYQDASTNNPWKPKSFQIISPGFDGKHGSFGQYDPNSADTLLSGPRTDERDNITNFNNGQLGQ